MGLGDWAFCHSLASDKDVIANSLSSSPPTLVGHARWMWAWTTGWHRMAWIIGVDGESAGRVGGCLRDDEVEVSIAVHPDYRGLGVGTYALKRATPLLASMFYAPVMARILRDNVGSIRAFESSGYMLDRARTTESVLVMRWRG